MCQSIFPGCRREWVRRMNTVSMGVFNLMAFPYTVSFSVPSVFMSGCHLSILPDRCRLTL